MQLRLLSIAFACVACVAAADAAESPVKLTDARILEELGARLDQLVAQGRFSGVVLVARRDRVLFERAYSYADEQSKTPNTPDTRFKLASMGKMFTGIAVLQLVQGGKLSLDDRLGKVLPDYPDKRAADHVTIRQLLTHTAGVADFQSSPEYQRADKSKIDHVADLLPFVTNRPLRFEPGSGWEYSNGGYVVLGAVVERVSGTDYYEYVQGHVFGPAGMSRTGFLADAFTARARQGRGTAETKGTPAGGCFSTAGDLLRFAAALRAHKLLNVQYTEAAMTGQVPAEFLGPGTKYGFGMEERTIGGVRIVGHDGTSNGVNTNLDVYPAEGYTVAVLSNVPGGAVLANSRLRWRLAGQELPRPVRA